MPWMRDDLHRTREHIDQALQYISMQERRLAELQHEGRDTGNAEELLLALRQTLILLVRHKAIIERDLEPQHPGLAMQIYSLRMIDRNGDVIGAYYLSLATDDDAKPEADKVLREYGCERVEVWACDKLVYEAVRPAT
jgi:hypothetical protein